MGDSNNSSEEKNRTSLSYWDPYSDCYRSKRTHKIVPDNMSDTDEDEECNSSDEEEDSNNSSKEKNRTSLSYWDPYSDCYRSKRTHKIVPDTMSETDEECNSSDEEEDSDDSS